MKKAFSLAVGIIAIGVIILNSCVKQSFDTPPSTVSYDPNIPVNLTISQLSAIANNLGSGNSRVMGDSTIYGIVVADDRSGNFYKQIIIQDSTGGIAVAIAQTSLFNDYPVGRKIYIKLKGLTIVNYKSLPEIALAATTTGALTVTGIPTALLAASIVKASFPNPVKSDTVRLTDLLTNSSLYVNKLVTLLDVEFDSTAINLNYAGTATSASRSVFECTCNSQGCSNTNSIVMYNSNYATFAPAIIPTGKGTITGIYSVYNTSPQLLLRDTSDVRLTNPRDCK